MVKYGAILFGIYEFIEKILPNPATDKIFVQGLKENASIKIYSITGKVLLETDKKEIDVQHLKSGIYLISFQTEKQQFVQQFIKK